MSLSFYLGIMSGTSLDGIDVAIVDLDEANPLTIKASRVVPFDPLLKQQLLQIIVSKQCPLEQLGQLDIALGHAYASAVNELLAKSAIKVNEIIAIGCHGQTLFHSPNVAHPFSMQIGNGNVIAELTGITTVTDFRQRDMVLGGQGAPLAPAFHQAVFSDPQQNRVIINIGGISNITILPASTEMAVTGFDTGPGNVLMDSWINREQSQDYDKSGQWAAQGAVDQCLLELLLADPYFLLPLPKSSGREYFNLVWLQQYLAQLDQSIDPVDVQATLLALTAITIANAIKLYAANTEAVFVCGGGAHNQQLMEQLAIQLAEQSVDSTAVLGLHPDWVEACAFAWMAKQTINLQTANLPTVTGARKATILGAVYVSSNAS